MAAADPRRTQLDKVRLVLDYAPAEALRALADSEDELSLLASLDRRLTREVTARRVTRTRVIVERPVAPPPVPAEIQPAVPSDLLVFSTPPAGEDEPGSAAFLTAAEATDIPKARPLAGGEMAAPEDMPLVLHGAVGDPAEWEPAWDVSEAPAPLREEPDDFTLEPALVGSDREVTDEEPDLDVLAEEEPWPDDEEDAFEIVDWPEAPEEEPDLDEEPLLEEPEVVEPEPEAPEVGFSVVEDEEPSAGPDVAFTVVEDEGPPEEAPADADVRDLLEGVPEVEDAAAGAEAGPEEEDLLEGLLEEPEPPIIEEAEEAAGPEDDAALEDLDLPEIPEEPGETEPAPVVEEEPGEDSVTRLEGVGTIYADRLRDAGIRTIADLHDVDPWRASQETDIASNLLERWVAVATLVHEGDVPLPYAEVLAQVGIASVEELEHADPEELARLVNDHLAARQDPEGPGPVTAADVDAWRHGS